MWYTVAFIAGAFFGLITMSVLAASGLGDLEWERKQLLEDLTEKEKELARNRDTLRMRLSNNGKPSLQDESAELSM